MHQIASKYKIEDDIESFNIMRNKSDCFHTHVERDEAYSDDKGIAAWFGKISNFSRLGWGVERDE